MTVSIFGKLRIVIAAVALAITANPVPAADLEFEIFEGSKTGIAEKSVLILGERDAILIDGQWLLSDGAALAEKIAATGKRLTHILITHGHPDHYMGLEPIREQFPDARIFARPAVVHEIRHEFGAKWMHWEQMFGKDIPIAPVVPEIFGGDIIKLEGHEIRFVDLPAAETAAATAFYVPDAGALITGDLVFSKMHYYFADLNNPVGWITALEQLKALGPIKTVFPGHGPVGGIELIDEAIDYMRTYIDTAQPGVPLRDVVPAMVAAYPDYGGELILWWTRGPGFGAFGPHAEGVPRQLLAALPPPLAYPAQGCGVAATGLVEKLFHAGFTGGNVEVLDSVLHEDFAFDDPAFPPGREGLKQLVAKNNASFSGWHFEIHDMLCDGDKITVRWSGLGRHTGSFMGEKPTMNDIELKGISIYLVEGDRIRADWVVPDNLGFLRQIGVFSSPDMTGNGGS